MSLLHAEDADLPQRSMGLPQARGRRVAQGQARGVGYSGPSTASPGQGPSARLLAQPCVPARRLHGPRWRSVPDIARMRSTSAGRRRTVCAVSVAMGCPEPPACLPQGPQAPLPEPPQARAGARPWLAWWPSAGNQMIRAGRGSVSEEEGWARGAGCWADGPRPVPATLASRQGTVEGRVGRSRVVHTLAQRRLRRPHHLSDFRVPPNQPDCPLHDSTSVPLCPWSPPHRAPHRVPWLHCWPLAW